MPIYAFQCQACEHRFERLQKLSDADPIDCPACGEPQVRRQLTAPSFRLAGAGWYETDFKKDGKKNLAGEGGADKSEAKADAKTESKPDAKPDAKPEAKAEPKPAAAPAAKPAGGDAT